MPNASWTIGTSDDGDVTTTSLLSELFTVRPGATIRPRFRMPSETEWSTLQTYVQAAMEQTVQAGVSGSGKAWYREELTQFPNVSSLVLELNPPSSLSEGGVWAVLVGGTDRSNTPRTAYTWELECIVLDELSAYADRTAVSNDLESEVI